MRVFYEMPNEGYDDQPAASDPNWDVATECAIRTAAQLADRCREIRDIVAEEVWLPASLSGQLVRALLEIESRHRIGGLQLDEARQLLCELASTCYAYNDLTAQSRALRLVRVLDLELAPPPNFDPTFRKASA